MEANDHDDGGGGGGGGGVAGGMLKADAMVRPSEKRGGRSRAQQRRLERLQKQGEIDMA